MRERLKKRYVRMFGFEYGAYEQEVSTQNGERIRGKPIITPPRINIAMAGFYPLTVPLLQLWRGRDFLYETGREILDLRIRLTPDALPEPYRSFDFGLVAEVSYTPERLLSIPKKREVFGAFVAETAIAAFQKCRSIAGFPYDEMAAVVDDYRGLGYRYSWEIGSKKLKSDVRCRVHAEISSEETSVYLELTCTSIDEDFSICVYREPFVRYTEISGLKHVVLAGGALRVGRHFAPYELFLKREHFPEVWANKLGIVE